MRRFMVLVTVILLMTAMLGASVTPAFAALRPPVASVTGGGGTPILRAREQQLDVRTEELKEHRRLLAAALERIPPALEAPPDASGSPEGAEPGQEGESSRPGAPGRQEGARRPWWRRRRPKRRP
jgi:hypothetical protein